MSNLATIKEIYEAFGRGDVPTIVSKLADDVEWEKWDDNFAQQADVPYLRYRQGPQAVIGFFQEIARIGIKQFRILSVMEGANQIAAEIELETATFDDQEIHLWTFDDDGRITRFRHYVDTAKHIAAAHRPGGHAV
jgi:ketosteroid isomerase-like protein